MTEALWQIGFLVVWIVVGLLALCWPRREKRP